MLEEKDFAELEVASWSYTGEPCNLPGYTTQTRRRLSKEPRLAPALLSTRRSVTPQYMFVRRVAWQGARNSTCSGRDSVVTTYPLPLRATNATGVNLAFNYSTRSRRGAPFGCATERAVKQGGRHQCLTRQTFLVSQAETLLSKSLPKSGHIVANACFSCSNIRGI